MQNIYDDINFLDKRCVEAFGLSEDLMMEHAANSLEQYIRKHLALGSSIFILCGAGNNGADGIALARMLQADYKVFLHLPLGVKSAMANIQLKRAKKVDISITNKLVSAKCYVDALFGSGQNKPLDTKLSSLIKSINQKEGLKIACDIPSGIMQNGAVSPTVFKADITITMGALKTSLFSDYAKEFVGSLLVSNLGVSKKLYETQTDIFLLEQNDMQLPLREKANVHKGDFGHLVVLSGEKKGAALLCAEAGFSFGAGLVSVLGEVNNLPYHIMSANTIAKNATALVCGMGLGELDDKSEALLLKSRLPMLFDADILKSKNIKKLLHVKKNLILTPHPKEFALLSQRVGFGEFSIEEIQTNRLKLAKEFSKKYPHVLVLKGANTIIAYKGVCYLCTFGTQALAKGGSGDVLAGLIASLLAQHYNPLKAAISGVLAHCLGARRYTNNQYSLKPQDIIKGIQCL